MLDFSDNRDINICAIIPAVHGEACKGHRPKLLEKTKCLNGSSTFAFVVSCRTPQILMHVCCFSFGFKLGCGRHHFSDISIRHCSRTMSIEVFDNYFKAPGSAKSSVRAELHPSAGGPQDRDRKGR